MDTGAARGTAGQMRAAAQSIRQTHQGLVQAASGTGWSGDDGAAFTQSWQDTVTRSAENLAVLLEQQAAELQRKAAQQDEVSGDGAAGALSGLIDEATSALFSGTGSPAGTDSTLRMFNQMLGGMVGTGVNVANNLWSHAGLLYDYGGSNLPGGALFEAIRNGPAGTVMKAVDLVNAATEFNTAETWVDKGHVAARYLSSLLIASPSPVTTMAGLGLHSYSVGLEAFVASDFSEAGVKMVQDEIARNPMVVVEEVGAAIDTVVLDPLGIPTEVIESAWAPASQAAAQADWSAEGQQEVIKEIASNPIAAAAEVGGAAVKVGLSALNFFAK